MIWETVFHSYKDALNSVPNRLGQIVIVPSPRKLPLLAVG